MAVSRAMDFNKTDLAHLSDPENIQTVHQKMYEYHPVVGYLVYYVE